MTIHVSRTRFLISALVLGIVGALTLWGRHGAVSTAFATQAPGDSGNAGAKDSANYSKQVIAYIYDTIPITRQDFGEYLIARCGAGDRIDNMINRCIIEHEARQRGIEVTAAEVEADFNETLKGINTNRADFVNKVLKPYHKSLYEWKEDVIKPRLLLFKMCKQRVVATEDDVKNAYEAYYGESVHCRVIRWRKNEQAIAIRLYPTIRDNEKAFDEAAKHQFTPELASKGGDVAAFRHYTTGNLEMEKAAFALQPGELTPLLETPDSFVVLKCVEHLPPTHTKAIEEARAELTEDIIKRKIDKEEIPKFFAELKNKAHPKIFLKDGTQQEDLMDAVRRDLTTPVSGSN
jgi:PPIC-type PPIASE domain